MFLFTYHLTPVHYAHPSSFHVFQITIDGACARHMSGQKETRNGTGWKACLNFPLNYSQFIKNLLEFVLYSEHMWLHTIINEMCAQNNHFIICQ